METESASSEEENNEQKKRDHIKDRLKEMGVSQDSVRPHKSWFSRNINYFILSIIAVLVGAFAIEYQSSNKMETDNSQVATQSPANDQRGNQAGNPYYNPPANGSMGMQPHSWAQPQYDAYNLNRENVNRVGDQSEGQQDAQQDTLSSAENNTSQNGNSGWYAQQRFYGQPPYYGQRYQQPSVQNQKNTQAQTNAQTQKQEQRAWSDNRQPTYRGEYNGQNTGQYAGQYRGNNNWPAYNPYYVPMPDPYSMPYPTAGYYNGWYR